MTPFDDGIDQEIGGFGVPLLTMLAGLASRMFEVRPSTNDPKEADRFTQGAMEHLERAQAMEAN